MRIKKEVRKIVASVLAFLMVVSLIPVNGLITKADAASTTTFVGGETVEEGTWKGWTWNVFGSSTDVAKASVKDTGKGGVTLEVTGNAGKINGLASDQGLNTFLYKLDKSVDFTITTKATVNSLDTNAQAAFGLTIRDAVGKHGDKDTFKEDKDKIIPSRNFVFVGGYGDQGTSGHGNAGYRTSSLKHTRLGESPAVGGTYDLAIQKVGDSVKLYFNGEVAAECSAKDLITDDTMYVGLFAARNANVTFNNVKLAYTSDSTSVAITDVTLPKKTTYCAGNTYADVDLTGFKATATVNGEAKTITAEDCVVDMSNDPFAEVTESGKLNLSYLGQTIEVPITVIKEVVSDMYIEYMPVKTDYMVTDTALDFTGLVGKVVYNSGRTFDLKTLIEEDKDKEDANTTVSAVDFTTPGDKEVKISHTYGDVTKEVIVPINVSDATVKDITITNPNTTRFYTDSEYDKYAYVEGLTITADYSDGTSKVIQGTDAVKDYVKAESTELDTTKAGKYVYVVEYNGAKATYELEVVEPTVTSLEVTTYPTTTTYVKGTDFSADGLEVSAVYDSTIKKVIAAGDVKVDSSAYKKDEAGTYDIKISATVDGKALETTIQAVVRDKKEFKFEDLTWNSIIFGQSIAIEGNKEDKPYMTIDSSEKGKVVITAPEGVGKCTDDGQEGIAYYYTKLDAQHDNFDITAKVTVNYFITKNSPDNQEGFGIMVRDSNGTDGDSSIYYSNAISVGGYYGQYNVFGRYGVTEGDASNRHNIYKFDKAGSATYKITEDAPKTFELRLKKDNSGIYAWMYDVDKQEYVTGTSKDSVDGVFYYLPEDTFSTIDKENMYLGFFAARGAKITVDTSSVVVNATDRAADAPQTFDKVAPTVPAVSQTTLSQTSSESYSYGVSVNTKGLLTIKQNGKTIESQKLVEKGTYTFDTTLIVGDNRFQAYFEPDATQNITSSAPVVMNATVNRRVIAPVKEAIYCAPNGKSTAAGTKEDPLDVQTALTYCQAGQAVYALGGTYNLNKTTGIWHGNDGTGEDGMKYFMAAPDNTEDVVFDFGGSFTGNKFVSNTFDLSGDYWYVSDMKFGNGGGVRLGGSHNIVENCDFYGHSNSGLSVSRTDGSNNKADWPSYNQIINCNAYNNSDKSQNNADGFAAKLTCGEGNVFKGCIAAYNADDGWDLFSKGATGAIGAVEIYDSVCYGNGMLYYDGSLQASKGDGNGFKMGGSGIAVNHEIYNSYSFGNAANGFTNNSDPMGTYVNLVGYNNGGSNLELHVYTGVEPQFTVENVKSYSDDTYKDITDKDGKELLSKTDKESKEEVIKLYYSIQSFFINKDGASVNSEGAELTAEDFKNLSDFKDIVNGGIEVMPEEKDGKVILGDFLQFVEDRPEEHVWGEWTVKTAPTCTEKGVEHRLCTKCDAEQTREMDALGHDFSDEFTVDKAPTVLEEGSKSRHCKHEGCDEKIDVTSIAKLTPDTVASGDMKDIVSVVVDTDDIEFTEAEKEAIANGADVKIEVDVKNIADSVSAKDKKAVEDILSDNYVIGSYIDISIVLSVGNDKRTITSTDNKIEFTITLPENLINTDATVTRNYKVVRVHDGETTILDAAFDAATGKLTFKSDKFSTYAIIYSDVKTAGSEEIKDNTTGEAATGESSATGDTTNSIGYVVLMIISVMALAGVLFYEKKRKGLSK